jgi:hypothetical protein
MSTTPRSKIFLREKKYLWILSYCLDILSSSCLTPPSHCSYQGKVALHLLVIVRIKASVHQTVAKSIEEIPVVQEFSDVFPDDLPGMPP